MTRGELQQKGPDVNVVIFGHNAARVEHLILALRLRWPDLKPQTISQGRAGLQVIEQDEPALVVLCDDLPDLTISAAIEEVRRFSSIPIMVVSEKTSETDLVKALELGADDFIRLPCSLMEVMVRAMAVLRRAGLSNQTPGEGPISCGDLVVDPSAHEVFLANRRIALTPTEFKLLYLLIKNRHMTLSQDFIQRTIWAHDIEAGDALKKYIQRLRRKLGDDAREPMRIKNIRGVGYRLVEIAARPALPPGAQKDKAVNGTRRASPPAEALALSHVR